MTGVEIDVFTSRLKSELAALDPVERADLIARVDAMERKMRSDGQERPVWRGPMPVYDLLGKDVAIPTEMGDRVGRVICFGVVKNGYEYERSVVIHVPSSGTQHEAPGSYARIAGEQDIGRLKLELRMAGKLAEAIEKPVEKPKRPKKTMVSDPALAKALIERARCSDHVGEVVTLKTGGKIVGKNGRKLYVLETRVDLSGFSVDHPNVLKLTAEEAHAAHLGAVRGQITFDDPAGAEDAFAAALVCLSTVV